MSELPGEVAPTDPSDAPGALVERSTLGQFVKGVSGNPAGRPKGARNRANLLRSFLEEALLRDLSDEIGPVIDQALTLAKSGDPKMIKLLLGDLLRGQKPSEADSEGQNSGPTRISVTINNYTGAARPSPSILDGVFTKTKE